VRWPLLTMPAAFCLGCYPAPDCADGYDREGSGKCVATDGAGGDTGSNPGPDDGEDTAAPDGPAEMTGPMSIQVSAETGGIVIEDNCVGTVTLSAADGVLTGTLSCTFGGTVASFIGTDPFAGTIDGEESEDGAVSGPFWMDLDTFGVLDTEWSGTLVDDRVDGALGDQMLFVLGDLEIPVDYAGTFSATR
jgi:hypothetical protein